MVLNVQKCSFKSYNHVPTIFQQSGPFVKMMNNSLSWSLLIVFIDNLRSIDRVNFAYSKRA